LIDLGTADWATLRVDRAEPANDLQRPDSPFCQRSHNTITCWPIKLTLTPMLADQVCAAIDLKPAGCAADPLSLSPAKPGKTPWALAF